MNLTIDTILATEYTLELSEPEIEWLHYAMTNPLNEQENEAQKEMRRKFFEVTML